MSDHPDLLSSEEVEAVFREVRERAMADVPILNHALDVAVIRFMEWQGYQLGVLLTPWFMNLVLFPGHNPPWPGLVVGAARTYVFPAGTFEFLLGEQAGLGRYLACSLYSPVFEFEDQAAAVATGEAVMQALFQAPAPNHPDEGPTPLKSAAGDGGDAAGGARDFAPDREMSRRAFLRGGGERPPPAYPGRRE